MRTIITILFIQLFLITSCANQNVNTPPNTRETFVNIEKTVNVFSCKTSENNSYCSTEPMMTTGSGVVIAGSEKGSYILTAAHVCDSDDITKQPGVIGFEVIIESVKLNEERHLSNIINLNFDFDVCILFAKNLKNKIARISTKMPNIGDRVFNIAAPVGIFYKNTVPILEGFFMGNVENKKAAYYSIPAAGGSSGSPIFDSKGHLVGMIHSVNIYFPMVSVSPTHEDMLNFIKKTIDKEMVPQMTPELNWLGPPAPHR
jgi:S1-C subfamily serine protease